MYKKFSIGLRVSKAFSAENKNKTITQTIAKTNNSVVVSDKILKINKDFFIVISNVDSKKKNDHDECRNSTQVYKVRE